MHKPMGGKLCVYPDSILTGHTLYVEEIITVPKVTNTTHGFVDVQDKMALKIVQGGPTTDVEVSFKGPHVFAIDICT